MYHKHTYKILPGIFSHVKNYKYGNVQELEVLLANIYYKNSCYKNIIITAEHFAEIGRLLVEQGKA
jgi:hypothetical protein